MPAQVGETNDGAFTCPDCGELLKHEPWSDYTCPNGHSWSGTLSEAMTYGLAAFARRYHDKFWVAERRKREIFENLKRERKRAEEAERHHREALNAIRYFLDADPRPSVLADVLAAHDAEAREQAEVSEWESGD